MGDYLLLDGHSLAFRAWFALQEAGMKTTSGQETQAVYGFVSMAIRLLDDFAPIGVAVAFDRREPTFRDEIAADYKLGRPPTPDPLISQIELIRQFVEALGVPAVDAPGFEADDVLATLATKLEARGDSVVVVTGDRDAYQLVHDPLIRVLYNRRGVTDYVLYDEAGIKERTGVSPPAYPLLAALRGDSSDNLPGVPGVGDKTAAKLVQTYGDVDSIYAHLDDCTPKLRASLAQCEAQVRRNLLLTPVRRDVPLRVSLDELELAAPDHPALEQFFAFLEMRTLRDRLFQVLQKLGVDAGADASPATVERATRPTVVVDDVKSAAELLSRIDKATKSDGRVALEPAYEASPGRSPLVGVAFAASGEEMVSFVPATVLMQEPVKRALAELVGSEAPTRERLDAFRAKELMRTLLPEGIDVRDLGLDVSVAAYLVDPAQGQESLEELGARRALSLHGASAPTGQLDFALADAPSLAEATAARAELVGDLASSLDEELAEIESRTLYEQIERPLVRVLAKMEVAGIGVDVERLRSINAELTSEVKALEAEIHAIAGEPFNVNSTTQLRVVLFERLGLRPQKKTKTGYSTDAQSLEKLRGEHPIIDALLRYREVEKLRSTYGESLIAEVASDGRIHASFHQTVARTGRLSSDRPNLHNIPVRTDDGRRFREVFVPAPGQQLLVVDYNQVELRVIAHLSDDPGLVGAFAAGEDIHHATAKRIFGVDDKGVTATMRARAKMVSYGLAYGMEAYGLSQRLSISVEEAAAILNQYFAAFPAVRDYMDRTVAEVRERGYTVTECGRRRYLPELSSDNFRVRQAAERQAMNSGIQGLAADIFKIALVRLDEALEKEAVAARVVLQVHDEVLVEADPKDRDVVEKLTLSAMRDAYPLNVPLEVNAAWGTSWADAK